MPLARISLTISPTRHSPLLSIPSGSSSRVNLVSVQSCFRYVLAGRLTIARPCEGVHRSTLLMSLSLLLQQCLACLVRLILMVLQKGGKYRCCFVRCCFQDLFNIAHSILIQLPSSFFYLHIVSVHVVHLYSIMDTNAARKKLRFILLDRSDFHMTDNQSIAAHAFSSRVFMTFSVDKTCFRGR